MPEDAAPLGGQAAPAAPTTQDAAPDVLAAEARAVESARVAAEHRSALSKMLADLRWSGKCDALRLSRLESAFCQFLLAQEAAASPRVSALQLAAQAEQAAMFEKLCERDLLAAQRDSTRFEALLSLTDFCEQLRLRAEQCTCEAGRAVPLRSYWLWSKEADDA